MFSFTPDTDNQTATPFFDDVTAEDGWEGHRTGKSLETLEGEIASNFTLLGCYMHRIVKGRFGNRYGFQIHFTSRGKKGERIAHRLDIACLPLDPDKRTRTDYRSKVDPEQRRIEGTQKMALFMVAKAVKGLYFLSVLAPSFVPWMSAMLTTNDVTLGELWVTEGKLAALLPPKTTPFEAGEEIIEGDVK